MLAEKRFLCHTVCRAFSTCSQVISACCHATIACVIDFQIAHRPLSTLVDDLQLVLLPRRRYLVIVASSLRGCGFFSFWGDMLRFFLCCPYVAFILGLPHMLLHRPRYTDQARAGDLDSITHTRYYPSLLFFLFSLCVRS